MIGSDFTLNFNKNMFGNSENDPRLIGRYIIANNSETMMKKSSFTTCKNIDGKCPAWSISADEVIHKKEKKRSPIIQLLITSLKSIFISIMLFFGYFY